MVPPDSIAEAAPGAGGMGAADPLAAVSLRGLCKTYAGGFQALQPVDLDIRPGEIFALLGPNGAGKTTLIGIICGTVRASGGRALAHGQDVVGSFRAARRMIGLVPQEIASDIFETVLTTVNFSRGLFGLPPDPAYIEKVLRDLSLWDKRNNIVKTLSGGMKRRLIIAKALSHAPRILFLDEPTAGVDVELRRDMWRMVRELRASGVTIVLTTHYIEEAEEMADRIGVIDRGRLLLVEDKDVLMHRLGTKQLSVQLRETMHALPAGLARPNLALAEGGRELVYTYDGHAAENGVEGLLRALEAAGIGVADLRTHQSSLEEIFVTLVRRPQ